MTNWKRSRAFYVDGLGFSVDWEHRFEPGFPVFAQLTRNGLSLFLTEHAGDCQVGGAAYFVFDDVDGFYGEISGRGIRPAASRGDGMPRAGNDGCGSGWQQASVQHASSRIISGAWRLTRA